MSEWEEVDYIVPPAIDPNQQVPRWDFEFTNTTVYPLNIGKIAIPDSYWFDEEASSGALPTLPHNYPSDYSLGKGIVRVANEADAISFAYDVVYVYPGYGFYATGNLVAVGASGSTEYCVKNVCQVSWSCNWPPGWTGGYSNTYTAPGSVWYSNYSPSNAGLGTYYTQCVDEITSTSVPETTTFIWYTVVV